jgi:acyl-CoA thioesterase
VSFVSVRLYQGDRACAVALVALADERTAPLDVQHQHPPHVPPPEACPQLVSEGGDATIRHRWETRWAIGPLPRSEGPSGDEAVENGGWLRLSESRPPDAAALVAMADAWIPPLLAVRDDLGFSVPTVELTVHLRDRAALSALGPSDWCLVHFWSRTVREGFVEEDGLLWSPEGRLLAQCRQLAILQPLPPGTARPTLRLEPPA